MTIESAPHQVMSDTRRLTEGQAVRFRIVVEGLKRDAFVVRHRGRILGYLNTCRHQGLTLDFGDGRFFDDDDDALVCCHHGARYQPESGICVSGPCAGSRLTALTLEEREGALWCMGVMRASSPSNPSERSP